MPGPTFPVGSVPPHPPFWPPQPEEFVANGPTLVIMSMLHAIEAGIVAQTAAQMDGVLNT